MKLLTARPPRLVPLAIMLAALASRSSASAEEPARPEKPPAPPRAEAPDLAALERRIAALEEQNRVLQADRANAPAPVSSEQKGARVSAAPGRGLTVGTADDRFSLTIRPRAQLRETFSHDQKGTTNEINVKTVRLTMHGHVLSPHLRFNVQLAFGGNDFDKDNASPLFDAFVEYVALRDVNIRVGQFFVPFDRARTVREFALQMVDRQQVVRELTLDRDVGLMLSSSDLFGSRVLGYHLFVGGGEGRNRFGGQAHGPLVVGRVVLRPFGTFDDDMEADILREKRPRLAVGFAGAYNHATNRQQSTIGTTFTAGTVNYYNAAADLVFKYAGFSLLAEGLLRRANVDHVDGVVDGAAVREWTRSGYGYFVQSGMMVHRLVELTARWEQSFARKATDPELQKMVDGQGNQAGGGLNVYLNGHAFKLQSDYFYIFGRDASSGRHVARLQLDATF